MYFYHHIPERKICKDNHEWCLESQLPQIFLIKDQHKLQMSIRYYSSCHLRHQSKFSGQFFKSNIKALRFQSFQSCYFKSYTYNFCQIINNIPSYGPTHYHHLPCHNLLWYSHTLVNLYQWSALPKWETLYLKLLSREKHYFSLPLM